MGVAYCDGKRFWEKAGASPLQCVQSFTFPSGEEEKRRSCSVSWRFLGA